MNEKITFEELPYKAKDIFAFEHYKVLEEGYEVIDSNGNYIYKLFPNGEKEIIKSVKSYKVTNKNIKLRWQD